MERQYVDSRSIASIGYDATSCILEIEFQSGAIWDYTDFPEYLWIEFEASASKGRFFHQNIKEQYTPKGYRVG